MNFIRKITTAIMATAITASMAISMSAGATDYRANGNNVRDGVWGNVIGSVNEGTVFTPDYTIYDNNGNEWGVNGNHYIFLSYCTPINNSVDNSYDISENETDDYYSGYSDCFLNYNQQEIYNHFKEQGFPESASLAIASNLFDESGCDPTSYCIDTNGLVSYGICQWNGERFENLKNFCYQNGYDYSTLNGQLAFLDYEFQNYYPNMYWQFVSSYDTRWDTTQRAYEWASQFEVCADYYWQGRADNAGTLWDNVIGY